MQSKLYKALQESFRARDLPVPLLPQYMQLPRIAVQQDVPRPAWSCGTIATCTTLHLLGDRHPYELRDLYITRARMIPLHRALQDWLVMGTLTSMWLVRCMHRDQPPPSHTQQAYTGPYLPNSKIRGDNVAPQARVNFGARRKHIFLCHPWSTTGPRLHDREQATPRSRRLPL
jgi:hypothetical protein